MHSRPKLLDAYWTLEAFADARGLGGLKARGLSTAILSNGSPKMLRCIDAAGIDGELDAVLSVGDPPLQAASLRYMRSSQRFGITPPEVVFVSSTDGT